MAWRIDPEIEAHGVPGADYDGMIWRWGVTSEDGAKVELTIDVKVTGTAMASAEGSLPQRVARARRTEGRTEIEAVLDWTITPDEIEINSLKVTRWGGTPGSEQLEVNEVIDWFAARGATVFLSRPGPPGESSICQAHIWVPGGDSFLYAEEGNTYLEVVEAAKAHWQGDRRGVYLELSPAQGRSSATLELTTPSKTERTRKAIEAELSSGAEKVELNWVPLSGSGEGSRPVHLLEIRGADGAVFEIGCGDDPEDTLLELAEKLLPSWHRPPERS